jgi:hypothetical protein
LQLSAFVCVPIEHDEGTHSVPIAKSAQEAFPLQTPVVPQVEAACVAQSLSGSVPTVTGAHVPFVPPVLAFVHASQVALHAVLQQTPSAQKLLEHSFVPAQICPLVFFGTHAEPLQ